MMKVVKCTCKHEFQDKKYGKGMRLANQGAVNFGDKFRCTVCGKEH